jgi:hypothetical protein
MYRDRWGVCLLAQEDDRNPLPGRWLGNWHLFLDHHGLLDDLLDLDHLRGWHDAAGSRHADSAQRGQAQELSTRNFLGRHFLLLL